jgi:hypothetical protein
MNNVPAALQEATHSSKPVDVLEQWKRMAWDRFDGKAGYPALRDFYEGYATATEDALRLLRSQIDQIVDEASDVADVVKHSHKLRNVVLVGAVAGGVIIYRRRKKERKKG